MEKPTQEIHRATAMEIQLMTEAIVNFRIVALLNYVVKDYADIRVKIDGIEKKFTMEEFKEKLGF